MKKFLAVFMGSDSAMKEWESLDEKAQSERERAGMKAWMDWIVKNEKFIIEGGSPLGTTKLVNRKGVSQITNKMTAWTVVQADNHDAAAKLFLDHPHFTIFPGDSVEVMECLPIPE